MALPTSPIGQSSNNPAAEAGVVQIDLTAPTGEIVTGAEFGLSTGSQDYAEYADPNFQAVADQYPVDLLRHNWGANTIMEDIFPTRASATSPTFTEIDEYLEQQANLTTFFNNSTGTQIVTLGFPKWLDISNPSDQTLYANMVKLIAQHFADMGEPINDYELVNEPDQAGYSVTDLADTFNVVAETLRSVSPNYKLGGLTESYMIASDLQTFFNIAGPNIGFVSWHQYVTGSSGTVTARQEVTDSMSWVMSGASEVRSMMQTAGIPASIPLFLGEYNLDYGDYNDPNNGNMVGAVAAAATTYGMIESNTNMTMGALWETANDSAYGVFGSGPNYQVDSVGVVLSNLTKYMPGNIVPTTMPSNTPGLVGYTTKYEGGFSIALIDTNLSRGYTVDLSQDGLPTTGLHRIEVSNTNPTGSESAISDLSSVSVPAGGVVIITNETSHGGTEYLGATPSAAFDDNSGTTDISVTQTQTVLAYVSNTGQFDIKPGVTYTLDTPVVTGAGGVFQIGTNSAELVLNTDTISGQTISFSDATATLVVGIDQMPTIDVPPSGTVGFTVEANPNVGLPAVGGFLGTISNFIAGDKIIVDTTNAATFSQNGSVISVIANDGTLGVLIFATAAQATLAAQTSGGIEDNLQFASTRALVWTGANGTDFGDKSNWNDTTSGQNPATLAPGAADTAVFDTIGGAVTGIGTVSALDVGATGSGALQLGSGTTLVTGAFDAGIVASAVGQIALSGSGTELAVSGAATVADDGTAVLSVLSGATFAAGSLTIGSQSDSSGAVVVSGSGSVIQLSGALNVGTAFGTGDLTVGPGAAVHASVVNLQGQVVLEGGLLDPTVQPIEQGRIIGGFGTIAADAIIDEGVIEAGGGKGASNVLVVQGTVLGGGTLSVEGMPLTASAAGLLRIDPGATLELTGPVLNAATTTTLVALEGSYTVTNSAVEVAFVDGTGVLRLDDAEGFGGTITAFQSGNVLDLPNIGFIPNSATATFSGGMLSVSDGSQTAHLALAGNYADQTFLASSDGHGGTAIIDRTALSGSGMACLFASIAPTASMVPANLF